MTLIENTDITAEEIALEGLKNLDSKYQKTVGFFAWDFFVAIGKILHDIWQKIIYIAHCLTDLSYMDYEDLKNFVYQTRGIKPKSAAKSGGYLTITKGAGEIKVGDVFTTVDGTRFQSIENASVKEGMKIKVECEEEGQNGNVLANTITQIPTTIPEIVAVTNEEPFTNGYDAESKESLLERYYEDIQKPTVSGNIYHYKKWALECTGVSKVKVKPLWNGEKNKAAQNHVTLIILDSNGNIPEKSTIDEVQNYIDPKGENNETWGCGCGLAPIGAYCTVLGAQNKDINVSCNIKVKSSVNIDNIKNEVQTSIYNYFKNIAFDDEIDEIRHAKIGALIMNIDGILDYSELLLNGSENNIKFDNSMYIAKLNELTLTEMGG